MGVIIGKGEAVGNFFKGEEIACVKATQSKASEVWSGCDTKTRGRHWPPMELGTCGPLQQKERKKR